MQHYAHSLRDQPEKSRWETLPEHEQRVADRCGEFLSRVNPAFSDWGELLGRWHDIGKYSCEFQAYLQHLQDRSASHYPNDVHQAEIHGKVDHSTAAAQWAVAQFGRIGKSIAYAYAGHHAGLPDWDDGESQSGLRQRLEKSICNWQENAPEELKSLPLPEVPNFAKFGSRPITPEDTARPSFRIAFWIRMMFSCLVDADFLATEAFMSPDRADERRDNRVSLSQIRDRLTEHLDQLSVNARDSPVNRARRDVRRACQECSSQEPGIFSLNVPTGGGKTLASLEFGLRHAIAHKLDRVIVAVPFTSIIEQNAQVYRSLFEKLSSEIVLEHHSNLDPKNETTINRLQSENWDAPIVVTTNVQLFESAFATRTSRCRKLHRIAHSVIILDEAQTLPVELLEPTLIALKELVEGYGCTVVLCTATQPARAIEKIFLSDWKASGQSSRRPIDCINRSNERLFKSSAH